MSLLCMLFSVAFCQIQISPSWLSKLSAKCPLSEGFHYGPLQNICPKVLLRCPVAVSLLPATGPLHMPDHQPGKFISLFLTSLFFLDVRLFCFSNCETPFSLELTPVYASFPNSNCSFTVCFPLVISYSSHNIQKMSYVRYLNPAKQSSSNDWLDLQKYTRKPPPSPGAFFKKIASFMYWQ